jgi:amino-acid N-acetyltransferase
MAAPGKEPVMRHPTERTIGPVRPEEVEALLALLTNSRLPLDGLRDHLETAIVAREGGRIIGSAALEVYADGALLRSVAVAPDVQGQGLGRSLTQAAIALARERRSPALYLLTTTAADYFPRFGFRRIERAAVPDSVAASIEFTSACPATAIVMQKVLEPAGARS